MKLYPKFDMILPFFVLQKMYQDLVRCNCRIKTSQQLCEEYGEAFSKNNEDIGRIKLVKMDIDTGDSPPVSSRPYTLPLKHYEWVQREIESLERAGIITKSMFKWTSPIVVIPKKSAPGEPPKRRLCVDFRKVNELQQEVIKQERPRARFPSIHFRRLMRCMQN